MNLYLNALVTSYVNSCRKPHFTMTVFSDITKCHKKMKFAAAKYITLLKFCKVHSKKHSIFSRRNQLVLLHSIHEFTSLWKFIRKWSCQLHDASIRKWCNLENVLQMEFYFSEACNQSESSFKFDLIERSGPMLRIQNSFGQKQQNENSNTAI